VLPCVGERRVGGVAVRDLVHEPHGQRLVRRDRAARHAEILSVTPADTLEKDDRGDRREDAQRDLRLAKPGVA
jgi:hypothetical protein